MRSGKIRIKKYKTSQNKAPLVLLAFLAAAVILLYLGLTGKVTLPSVSLPSFTKEDTQQESRVLTLEQGKAFALQLGVFSEKSGADALAKEFIGRGAAGYVHHQDGYRVLAAVYATREEAAAVQTRLSQQHGVDVYIYPMAYPGITLRLNGQKSQLNALEDACSFCVQLSATLSHLSQSLDQGTMKTEEIRQALSSQQVSLQALCARLQALFQTENHPAVTALSEMMNELQVLLSQCISAENETRLGSSIKYCQLHVFCGLESYIASLTQ